MSKSSRPENFFTSFVDEFNRQNISYLLASYEHDACFVSQTGQVVKGQENIRQNLRQFIDMKGKLETSVKSVFSADDIALVISEWSFSGIRPDGKAVSLKGKATDVLRQHSDGTWGILIDNPWGTDIGR